MASSTQRLRIAIAVATLVVLAVALVTVFGRGGPSTRNDSARPAAVEDAGGAAASGKGPRPILAPRKGTGEHSIAGWVRGSDGGAISMAQITATMELGPGVDGMTPDLPEAAAIVANSGADGSFSLEGLEPGRYRLSIEGQGLVTAELRFVDAPGTGLVILVSREVTIRGRLLGSTAALSAVGVFLRSETATQQRELVPSDDGSFEFSGLAEGRFQLWAQGPGQAAPTQWVERYGVQEFSDLSLTMQEAFAVTGRVVDEGSSELGVTANVVVRSLGGLEPPRRAVSGADGSFRVDGLLAGRWIADASAPGYLDSSAQAFAAESNTALLLELDSGGQVSGVVESSSGGVVAGAIVQLVGTSASGVERRYSGAQAPGDSASTLASGQRFLPRGELGVLLGPIPLVPPPGAYVSRVAAIVTAGNDSDEPQVALGRPSVFTTDSSGRFHIAGVEAGTYRLHVSHPEYADGVSKSLRLVEGGKPVGRTVTLRAGTRLSGQVLTDKGVAVVGASVFAHFTDDRDPAMTVTDADGNFVFSPMSGAVELAVEAVGFGRVVEKHKLSAGGLVAVVKHLEIRLVEANAVMEGRVVDSSRFAIRNATVSVLESPDSLPVRPARTDADGLFRLEGLMPGSHWVRVVHPEFPPLRVKVEAALDIEITVPLGADLDVLVTDAQSQAPLALAELSLARGSDGQDVRAVTDAQGHAEFRALSVGDYTIRALLSGYASTPRRVRLVARNSRTEAAQQESIELNRGSTLAGILLSESGDRVAGATVSSGPSRTMTDQEGRFRLVDVASGNVQIEIEKGGQTATVALEVEVGEERVTMELRFLPDGDDSEDGPDDSDSETEESAEEAETEEGDDEGDEDE